MRDRIMRLFVLFFLVLSGCGYTSGSLLPDHMSSIFVQDFENKIDHTRDVSDRRSKHSYRPNLERDIRRSVIDRFMFDGNLQLVGEENADLILKGAVTSFEQVPLSYDDHDNIESLRIRILVDLELYDNNADEVLWRERSFMGQEDYNLVGKDPMSEETAVREAIRDLSKRIVERTVEAW